MSVVGKTPHVILVLCLAGVFYGCCTPGDVLPDSESGAIETAGDLGAAGGSVDAAIGLNDEVTDALGDLGETITAGAGIPGEIMDIIRAVRARGIIDYPGERSGYRPEG